MTTPLHLSHDVIVARRAALVEAEVDGEIVALHIDKGTCYHLRENNTGAFPRGPAAAAARQGHNHLPARR